MDVNEAIEAIPTDFEPLDVLAVAPHPDDLEILCGGTLAKLVQQGYRVGILDLTSGEPTPRGSLEKRRQEAEAARQHLGVPFRWNLNLPNRVLMDEPANRFPLATIFRKLKPNIVIGAAGRTPAASPDHHQGHLLIEAARFYSQLTKWDEKFFGTSPYRVPHLVYALFPTDAEQRHFNGSFVIDISDTMEAKIESIRAYDSQFDGKRFENVDHFIRANNAFWGGRCGYKYGELFAMPHLVGTDDLVRLVKGSQKSPTAVQLPGRDHLPMG